MTGRTILKPRKQIINETKQSFSVQDVLLEGMYNRIFPKHQEIIPQLNEVYELALAFYESQLLRDEELIRNGAYFARIGNQFTRHFLMCTGEPVRLPKHSSSRLTSFFTNNQFKTGYATHGLFPYRGKFHPQMIKALLNVMGLKPGDTVLDPMMGSGTVLIEACLMGINSIGIDASPFCRFMTQSKLNGLVISLEPLEKALKNYESLFAYFVKEVGQSDQGCKSRGWSDKHRLNEFIREKKMHYTAGQLTPYNSKGDKAVDDFLLLSYLDSVGYSERSSRKPPIQQFRAILERYIFVVEKIQTVLQGVASELAESLAMQGDARALPLESKSVDGILFSPPYSFAIDYLKNDSFHLDYLGSNIDSLKKNMIGLRGRGLREKYNLYIEDMSRVLFECARVIKPGRFCTLVVGTNDRQLGKALNVPPEQVPGLHKILANIATANGFTLLRMLARRITGMVNTMRNEFIVILVKN